MLKRENGNTMRFLVECAKRKKLNTENYPRRWSGKKALKKTEFATMGADLMDPALEWVLR